MTLLSDQELFDRVATHLFTQGKPAIVMPEEVKGDEARCLYRAPNGLKCAAGAVLPDELYDPEMEGKNLNDDMVRAVFVAHVTKNIALLSELQRAHDDFAHNLVHIDAVSDHRRPKQWETTEGMRRALTDIAHDYPNVDPSIVKTLSFEDR